MTAYLHPHHTPLTLMVCVRSQIFSSVLTASSSLGVSTGGAWAAWAAVWVQVQVRVRPGSRSMSRAYSRRVHDAGVVELIVSDSSSEREREGEEISIQAPRRNVHNVGGTCQVPYTLTTTTQPNPAPTPLPHSP